MEETRFADLAAIWGGDIDQWPAAEQPAARALLPRSTAARLALAEAAALDELIAEDTAPMPDNALMARILADAAAVSAARAPALLPARAKAPRRAWWLLGERGWGAGLAGAACLVLGLMAGAALPAVDALWTGTAVAGEADVFDIAFAAEEAALYDIGEDT